MKTQIFLAALLILFSQTGCKQAASPNSMNMLVNFEIESAFQDDSVKVILDDKILLEDRVTTNYSVNLAWSSGLRELSRDRHDLNFAVIEYGVQKDFIVDSMNDTSTVMIRFDQNTKQISIQQMKGVLLRD